MEVDLKSSFDGKEIKSNDKTWLEIMINCH